MAKSSGRYGVESDPFLMACCFSTSRLELMGDAIDETEVGDMTRTMLLITALVLAPMVGLQAAEPSAASAEKLPGQLVALKVNDGYHVSLFIVLNGTLQFAGQPSGELASAKTILWVNNFSSTATLDGKFSVMFPIASLPLPTNPKGIVVRIKALQEKTNVVATVDFDLSQLNQLVGTDLTIESLRELKAKGR
jgi:hypothetical protein